MTEKRINVIELGEDSDDWLVVDASSAVEAIAAVRDYFADMYHEPLEQLFGEDHVELDAEHRDDWAWESVVEGAAVAVDNGWPDDEAFLRHGEKPEGATWSERFAGYRVRGA